MLRPRLIHSCLALAIGAGGCAQDLEIDPDPIGPRDLRATVAQFDPTNPIPVLTLIPTPTALAENPDGTINKTAVAPEACELPTTAQCLQFVDGWPLTTPITLFFNNDLDGATITNGIKLYEIGGTPEAPMVVQEVPIAPICPGNAGGRCPDMSRPYSPKSAPNPACMTEFGLTTDDLPLGIELTLAPTVPLKPSTRYMVKVESYVDANGGVVGLTDDDGNRVEPSALFSLVNVEADQAPVNADGTEITNAILRAQAKGGILAALFDGRPETDLDAEEKAQFDAALAASTTSVAGLYRLFGGVGDVLIGNGVLAERTNAVFLNAWTTGPAAGVEATFDTTNRIFPFPNAPVFTVPTSSGSQEVQVNLPIDPMDSPTAQALTAGLNTLDGFALTGEMAFTFTDNVDPATLDGQIAMYPVDADFEIIDEPVDLEITYTASTALGVQARISMVPVVPLQESTTYVVVVRSGITDTAGRPVVANSTFRLIRDIDAPFIDANDVVLPQAEQALQCSTVAATGALADATTVVGLANSIEQLLGHAQFTQAVQALENFGVARDQYVMAYSYRTQSVTSLLKQAALPALDGPWMGLGGDTLVGPIFSATSSGAIDQLIGVEPLFCVGFCEAGAFCSNATCDGPGDVPPSQCATRDGEGNITAIDPRVPPHPTCQLAKTVIVSNLGRADLYLMKGFKATAGSPYSAGAFSPEKLMTPDVVDIPVWVIQPAGTPPAEGWPAMIFQHGIGQEKENGFLLANTISRTGGGWATVMIDLPFHGARASDLIDNTTGIPCADAMGVFNVDPVDVTCDSTTGTCTGGCDDVQDPSATGYLSPNLFGVRDNFRQSTIDHMTLIRALQSQGMAGGTLDTINGDRIGYIGQSLGSITGANLAAYATPDDLEAIVANVGGGSLLDVIENTVPDIAAPLFAALAANGICEFNTPGDPTSGCALTPDWVQFRQVVPWVLDPGDPLGTSVAANTLGTDRLMIQMSRPDLVVPNISSRKLGLAWGFDLNTDESPFESNDDRFQIYDFSPLLTSTQGNGCHGWLLQPACGRLILGAPDLADFLCNTVGAQEQAAGFVDSAGATTPPQRPLNVFGIPCQ